VVRPSAQAARQNWRSGDLEIQLGSIVSFKKSRWVVIGTSPSSRGRPDLRIARLRHGRLESLMVGPEGLKLIEVPRFQPGERLKLSQGREGVVLEDSGDDTVKLHEVTMRDLRGEGRIKVEGISIVSRSSLVLANRMK
jgi:hypothetical protein